MVLQCAFVLSIYRPIYIYNEPYVLMSLMVSVDVKQHLRTGHSLSLICQPISEDIKLHIIVVTLSARHE